MKKFVLVAILFLIGIFLVASAGWTAQCGNTVREGNEECDQGSSNCDN